MESFINRISFKTGNILGFIKTGNDSNIKIILKNKAVYGLLNETKLIESSSCDKFISELSLFN